MTKGEIVQNIMDRLNLTSTTARTRIGNVVDRYYLRATAAIGVKNTSRRVFDIESVATIGDETFEFDLMEKITRIYYVNSNGEKVFPREVTIDELREISLMDSGDEPARYAVRESGAMYVIIQVDMLPETAYSMFADGYGNASALDDDQQPIFPESFHDILVEGPLKDEYKKLGMRDLAKDSRDEYEMRLAELRQWGATSAYLKIQQGGRARGSRVIKDNSGVPWSTKN